MRLPLFGRLIATVMIGAIAYFLYIADAGLTASFASEDDSTSQEEEAHSLELLAEQIAALEARIIEVEANQDELAAQEVAYPVFDAIAAAYLMDQIDIHALHEQLHDGEGIMPGDAGPIKRLVPLLSAVDWPEELAEEGAALVETLTSWRQHWPITIWKAPCRSPKPHTMSSTTFPAAFPTGSTR